MSKHNDPRFGIYIHWPYCQSLCPYCDFNKYLADRIDQDVWRENYIKSLKFYFNEISASRCDTVYFGGGTPSLMSPSTCGDILDTIDHLWGLNGCAEITLEANPNSVEREKFHQFKLSGVNRISLGLQSLDSSDLKTLGRKHSVEDALEAFQIARSHFSNVNIDLIFGRQNQTLQAWEHELQEALQLKPHHLSLYQLTIEPGTAFGKLHAHNKLKWIPCDEILAAMFELNISLCKKHGFKHYEVSNFALPTYESAHNTIYWRYYPFLGIGPGAHGRIKVNSKEYHTETIPSPNEWLETVNKNGSGESQRIELNSLDRSQELLMMGLRLREGISIERYNTIAPTPLDTNKLQFLVDEGFITIDNGQLKPLTKGYLVLNRIIFELLDR